MYFNEDNHPREAILDVYKNVMTYISS
jgi:hypothetical protein